MARAEEAGRDAPEATGAGGLMRIERITLHDAVLTQIRDMIIEGKLAPGSRINEGQVGALLGVSRTPLREAIKSLAGEGLIEIVPAKGAIVRQFNIDDIRSILEILKIIEQAAARLACERASAEGIARIKAMHDEMVSYYRGRNRLAYFKLNQAIHSALVALADNPVISEMHAQLQARIKRIRFIGNNTPDRWSGALDDHEEILQGLIGRDVQRLVEAVGVHLDRTLERVRDVVSRE
jgi:DNA-binding GntR family transcriptional regulator